ncbi:MAG TPA: hypothetical protein VK968_17555, partial [Roseimicrobium sp.]|nr:hypothetical protein [Roseimicrobium sp.]
GQVCLRDRLTGEEKLLGNPIRAEDAHRVACQQWVSGGSRVVFHGERDGKWIIVSVDLKTGQERVLAQDRLAGWGQPDSDIVPLYGLHWNPGEHRDLELLDVGSGKIRTVLKMDAVKSKYPEWYGKNFGDQSTSIFFPVLSPDLKRVFFKMAANKDGDPRSGGASARQGLVCYSLADEKFLYMNPRWGHPSWQPDSRMITEAGNLVYDSNDGAMQRVPGLPSCSGDHPSVSPDGRLRVTDTTMDKLGGDKKNWGIVLADARGTNHIVLHQFDDSKGASSWRRSHPHPIFSSDNRRIYFNVSSDKWTTLYVAERATQRRPNTKE